MEDVFNNFIKGLTDHELAVYIGYQYQSLLPYAKKKIKLEVERRKLTKQELEKYYQTKLSYSKGEKFCEICGSNKFISDVDIEHHSTRESSSYDLEVTTMRCRLCNYNPSKVNPKSMLERIKRLFYDPNSSSKVVKYYDWDTFN